MPDLERLAVKQEFSIYEGTEKRRAIVTPIYRKAGEYKLHVMPNDNDSGYYLPQSWEKGVSLEELALVLASVHGELLSE